MSGAQIRAAIPVPPKMTVLPLDQQRRLPIPWFVAMVGGTPDFRVIRRDGVATALRRGICWICGTKLGQFRAYVVGPTSIISRATSEPPCHRECAEYAARACPFLANPDMRRQPRNLPDDAQAPEGLPLARNPGVACIWITRDAPMFQRTSKRGGVLRLDGEPSEVLWYREGRPATRPEVYAALEPVLPDLLTMAKAEGAAAVEHLKEATRRANTYLPALRPGDVMPEAAE